MTELRRQFYDVLVNWKARKGNECLLVKGARQIGKTYIIRKFGRENYENYLEINFLLNPEFTAAFNGGLRAEDIFSSISVIDQHFHFIPGKTLLFLDEIQECPNARTALKSLAMSEKCDVVASGSLLGIRYKGKRKNLEPKSIAVGYERQVTMHSLSFEEYLWARGYGDEQIQTLRSFFKRREKVPDAVNGKFHKLLREYAVVGGMPEVVRHFVENRHFGDVQRIQEAILATTLDDIHKYASAPDVPKIEQCYTAIPRILSRENRKFKYRDVDEHGSARKYLSCVEWLNAAHLSSMAECVSTPEPGLAGYVRDGWFKLYMADIGLLLAKFGALVKSQLLDDSLAGNIKGGVYENLVAGMLERRGIPLRYYKNDDVEMEFLIETGRGIVPLEVKAKNGATQSLNKMLTRNDIPFGYKFTGGNVGVSDKKITLPHYMAMFVEQATMGVAENDP